MTRMEPDGGVKNWIAAAMRVPRREESNGDEIARRTERLDGDLPQLRHQSCRLLWLRHEAIRVRFEFWFFGAAL
ncbi:hypothetical protein TIFTF001_021931 [Ficus carica]|uniref:Uncharacterized protein n=1 Tax=Ficus carica TaxID=3494 RepID=A0AA88ABI2_FICCA|nr:hypothetical protein TIFTF001_021931 [Ficus carica]